MGLLDQSPIGPFQKHFVLVELLCQVARQVDLANILELPLDVRQELIHLCFDRREESMLCKHNVRGSVRDSERTFSEDALRLNQRDALSSLSESLNLLSFAYGSDVSGTPSLDASAFKSRVE